MTHDFHYYASFMCARNAGFSVKDSHRIALCADAVDGGTMKAYNDGLIQPVGGKKPLTVLEETSDVNMVKSLGSSVMATPWMAFHFLPALELYSRETNPYGLILTIQGGKSKKISKDATIDEMKEVWTSRELDSGLVCSKKSRFARKLIKDTAAYAQKVPRKDASSDQIAFLGIRAHIIADLFAHEGFAGLRSMSINALSSVTNLKEKETHYNAGLVRQTLGPKVLRTGVNRLGHGQAGQFPDEPFLKFSWTRSRDQMTFTKDNYEDFGQAVMAVTEALKGTKNIDFMNWRQASDNYAYHWDDIRWMTNQERKIRNLSWIIHVSGHELAKELRLRSQQSIVFEHDGSDYRAFEIMDKVDKTLKPSFVKGADTHLKWFHEQFYTFAGCNLAQYLNHSILWKAEGDDYGKARQINDEFINQGHDIVARKVGLSKLKNIISGKFTMDRTMIGVDYFGHNNPAMNKPSHIRDYLQASKKRLPPKRPLPPPPLV